MNNFLNDAQNQLRVCMDKQTVMTELDDHLQTKKEFFEDLGYDEQSSFEKANEAMGDGEIVGQRLNVLHTPKYKQINLWCFIIAVCNIVFPFIVGIPSGEDIFIRPFFSAVLILIINFAFTAFALKVKNRKFSVLILIFSLITMHVSLTKLTYPICNLLLSADHIENIDGIYQHVKIVLTIILLLLLIFPNIYNIYYCNQINNMKNTKKQNVFAKKLIAFCIVLAVIFAALSYPFYYINRHIANTQDEIHREFIDFALEIDDNFDYTNTKELITYLDNCENDFVRFDEDDEWTRTCCIYKGNWEMRIYVNAYDDDCGYYIYISPLLVNSSQSYLFANYESEDKLIRYLGDDEVEGKTGLAVGSTKSEIRKKMNEINSAEFRYYCDADDNSYYYLWYLDSYLYGIFGQSDYEFHFDNDDNCISYGLTLD